MNPNCKDCGKCCLNTEMVISQSDIKRIIKNFPHNLRVEDFTLLNEDKLFQLINIEDHCFFFDYLSKSCKIYNNRPQGCVFYPLIFDLSKNNCIFDEDCPRTQQFYKDKNEKKEICSKIRKFLQEDLKILD